MTTAWGGAERRHVEIPTLDGESIRVTWIPELSEAPSWAGEPRVRINKVDANGRVFPGPEIPRSRVPDFVRALVDVTLDASGA